MRRFLLTCVLLGVATLAWPQSTVHRETVVWDFVNGLRIHGVPLGGAGSTGADQLFVSDAPGSGVWRTLPNTSVLGYDAASHTFTVGTGGGGAAGGGGTLQASNGSGGFAAYSGSNTCEEPTPVQYGVTSTGVALCRASAQGVSPARPWLAQASSLFPNGFNLGALAPGLVTQTVSGGLATPSVTALPAGAVMGDTAVQDVFNKRNNWRVFSLPSTVSPLQINLGTAAEGSDVFIISDLAQNTQMGAPLGTARAGQIIFFQVTTTVARTLTWDAAWAVDAAYPLPTTTTPGAYDIWLFQYNAGSGKWTMFYNSRTIKDVLAPLVASGTYSCPTLTLTAAGKITAITNGVCTGGGGTGVPTSTTLTVAGTANEVQVAGGTQDLNANRSWTAALAPTLNLSTHPLLGALPLVFDGATTDGFKTSLAITDPTANRTLTVPNADSVTVQPDAGVANNFLTGISTAGVITKAQPATTNLSDGATLVKNNTANTFSGAGALTGLPTPVGASDAATKGYVDGLTAGFSARTSVRVATTAALTATYANGTAGVGATLTNSGTLAALAIDGITLSVADRVLVKNQASALQNGIYTVTTVGTGAVAWVLTRATDYDQSAEVAAGSYTLVGAEGTTNKNTLWIQTTPGTITLGTTALVFNQLQTSSPPLTNIPDNTVVDNKLKATAVTAPATPPAGFGYVYFDSSSKDFVAKDDAGVVHHGVQTMTPVASQWLRSVDDTGLFTRSQPAFSDVSGSASAGQVPNLENLNGTLTTAKGGTGFTDTTFGGTTHKLATQSGSFAAGNCLTTDVNGNLVTTGAGCGGTGGGVSTSTTLTVAGTTNEIVVSGGTQDLSTSRTWTAALAAPLNLATHTLLGGTPLVFEGASQNAFATSLVITDPTANRTLTVPDANSVTVQPDPGTANSFLTGISPTTGIITKAQPSTTNLSDGATLVKNNSLNTFSGAGALTGLPTPTAATDAATKGYVDGLTAGFAARTPVRVATAAALTATYANGTAGVGATLTNSGTLAALAIDGVTLSSTDRVLVKDQTTAFQNGIYTVTTVGTGAIAWVLTRATDYDQSAEVAAGSYTLVGAEGTTNKNTLWIQTTTGTITMGTTALVFNQLAVNSPPLTNIPDGTVLDNKLKATAVAAPATPAAGFGYLYFESSSKNVAVKDDAGVVKHGVQTMAPATSLWLRSVDDAGLFTRSQPSFADLTGSATAGQVPNVETLNGTLTTAKGGTGFTDTTYGGTTHKLATQSGTFVAGNCVTTDTNGNFVTTGAPCGSGSGGGATPAGLAGDVQLSGGTVLDADSGNFLHDTATHTTVTDNLQVAAGGTSVLEFTDAAGHVDRVTTLGALTTDRSHQLPDEDGVLCVKNGSCFSGGAVSISGTPSSGQAAEWVSVSAIQGVAVTGTGSYVKATTPTLVTPVLGVATATSINKVALTAPATAATLTIADNKTLTVSNSLTLAGTDTTTLTFQGTDTYVGRATTDTLTNKRVTKRVTVLTTSTTYTCPGDTSDQCRMSMTGTAGTLTVAAPTGTPADGDMLILRFKCTNAQTFSFNATFLASPNVALPTTCPADTSKETMVGVLWSSDLSKWQVIASN